MADNGNALTRLLESTAQQVRLRQDGGDAVDAPRLVDHVAFFRRKSDALAAGVELSRLGYHVARPRRRWLLVELGFTKEQAVDAGSAAAFTTELHQIARAHRGIYDGWGGFQVERDAKTPRP